MYAEYIYVYEFNARYVFLIVYCLGGRSSTLVVKERHDSASSRPGPLSLSATSTSSTAASASDNVGNGINGKGGSSSSRATTITELRADEDGGTSLNNNTIILDNNNQSERRRRNINSKEVKSDSGENHQIAWRQKDKGQVRRVAGGGDDEGSGSVDGVCVGGDSEQVEDLTFRVAVEEHSIPWKFLWKERCSKVYKTRTRFIEPCALPQDVDLWPLKMARPTTPITAFFKNRSVFVTGATGFLGKACVEKLLRTCPDVTTVYTLIRPKSGSDVQARLQELLDNSVSDSFQS